MKTYCRNNDVSWRLDEGRRKTVAERLQKGDLTGNRAIVVLSLAGTLYDLDMVGADVWIALDAPQSVEQIADAIIDRYDVARPELVAGVDALLLDMERSGLVRPAA
ncbi:MAG: PqqD family peptide modification chaperone [Magnetococcales bacterium]|nr:PqqD family peptide modification chaperone [Magnetococcales bacterium]